MNNNLKKGQYNLPTIDDMFNFYTTGVKVQNKRLSQQRKAKTKLQTKMYIQNKGVN